ncbi:MAG TPA: hypothetical protein VH540_16150 [Ktedonobacterales bacterium]|jgi:photosystem II stability/assembly factor-like uncharacterized protein
MAQDDDSPPPREIDLIDEWLEHALSERPLRPYDGHESPAPRLVQELEDFYLAEAQAVEGRLERVRQRLEDYLPAQERGPELLPEAVLVSGHERREHHMKESGPLFRERRHMKDTWFLFLERRHWSARLSTLVAAVLLFAVVGGMVFGLVLVRHGGKTNPGSQSPVATDTPFVIPTPTEKPAGSDLSISQIAMKDANQGWATGYRFPIVNDAPPVILHTSDGGVHWANVSPARSALRPSASNALARPLSNGASVRTEDFLTGSVAWELILPNHLYKTVDGGQTWQEATVPGDAIRQFTFLDAQNGWVITEDAGAVVVFRTTNGGATWTRMQHSGSAFRLQDAFWGVRFISKTTGWAVFINNTVGRSAVIYKTTDSGATWRYQQIALPAGVIPPVFPSAPVFFNDHEGMMEVMFADVRSLRSDAVTLPNSGGSPEGLYVTHNGGASWDGPIVLNGLEFPNFVDALHGWALNSTGSALLTTSDSGRHWTPVNASPNFNQIEELSFVSGQVGWALKFEQATQSDLLLKTVDGGQTWTQLNVSISN